MSVAISDQVRYRTMSYPGNGKNNHPVAKKRRIPVVVRIQSRVSGPLPVHRRVTRSPGTPGAPVPASKTGPGLPPVRPQRRPVKQLCLSQIHCAAHLVVGREIEKKQVNKGLNFNAAKVCCFIFCYNLSSKTKSCTWCNDNMSLR